MTAWFCLLLLGPGADVQAQDHGQIAGTVKDADGGVLIGATVEATNVDTGCSWSWSPATTART